MPYITFGKSYPEGVQVPSHRKYEDLIKVYKEKMIHGSRSLDQFYYDSLPNLSDRDAGQVVTRYLTGGKRQHEVQKLKDWPFLTVNQLWLWVIDESRCLSISKTSVSANVHVQRQLLRALPIDQTNWKTRYSKKFSIIYAKREARAKSSLRRHLQVR